MASNLKIENCKLTGGGPFCVRYLDYHYMSVTCKFQREIFSNKEVIDVLKSCKISGKYREKNFGIDLGQFSGVEVFLGVERCREKVV